MLTHPTSTTRTVSRRKPALFSYPETLEQALYMLAYESGVTIKAQAHHLGRAESYFYNCVNPSLSAQYRYPLCDLLPHTQFNRNPVVLDFFEREIRRVAVPVVDQLDCFTPPPSIEALPEEVAQLAKELGDVAGTILKSIEDGRMQAPEATASRKEVWELVQRATALHHRLGFWKD